jgi:hypothetical protein
MLSQRYQKIYLLISNNKKKHMGYLHRLYHPEIFQGNLDKRNYFEGWYFKIVAPEEKAALAVIPGVSIGRDEPDHAFIQVLDGVMSKSYYYRFPLDQFSADEHTLDIRIGDNKFSEKKIELHLKDFEGDIKLEGNCPIPKSVLSPGIMGWYSFMPRMECYHGIVSMHHSLNGSLMVSGKSVDFGKGIGYLEKDWGTSFPKCWIWAHSNHFHTDSPISVMASVAHIPWMGNYFIGFIVAFLYDGKVEIFATYNNSKRTTAIVDDKVFMTFYKGKKQLKIVAHHGPGAELRSPIKGLMTGKVNESLQARLDLTYSIKDRVIFQGSGTTAGLEVAGETEILMA